MGATRHAAAAARRNACGVHVLVLLLLSLMQQQLQPAPLALLLLRQQKQQQQQQQRVSLLLAALFARVINAAAATVGRSGGAAAAASQRLSTVGGGSRSCSFFKRPYLLYVHLNSAAPGAAAVQQLLQQQQHSTPFSGPAAASAAAAGFSAAAAAPGQWAGPLANFWREPSYTHVPLCSSSSDSSSSSQGVRTLQEVCEMIESALESHAAKLGFPGHTFKVTPASSAANGFELQVNIASLVHVMQQHQQQDTAYKAQDKQSRLSAATRAAAPGGAADSARPAATAAAAAADYHGLVHLVWEESSILRMLCSDAQYTGKGFVSFELKDELLLQLLRIMEADASRLAASPAEELLGLRLVLDYFSPNVAKDLHTGHLRNALIGDSLARLLEFVGVHVHRSCHFGDCGLPLAVCLGGLRVYRQLKQQSSSSSSISGSGGSSKHASNATAAARLHAAAEAVVAATQPRWKNSAAAAPQANRAAAAVAAAGADKAIETPAAANPSVSDEMVHIFMSHIAALDAALKQQQQQQQRAAGGGGDLVDWEAMAREPLTAEVDLTAAYVSCMRLHESCRPFAAAALSTLGALVGGEETVQEEANLLSLLSKKRFAHQLRLFRLSPQAAEGERMQLPRMPRLLHALAARGLLVEERGSSSSSNSSTSPLSARLADIRHPLEQQQQHQQQQQQQQQHPASVAIRRQGGSYTYIATDLAALQARVEGGASWVLHLTDKQQASHFHRLFLLAQKLLDQQSLINLNAQRATVRTLQQQQQQQRGRVYMQHLGVGLVVDSKGAKLGSRNANAQLEFCMQRLLQETEAELRRRRADLDSKECRRRAEIITAANLRLGLLSCAVSSDFRLKASSGIDGSPAMPILYALTRASSVCSKAALTEAQRQGGAPTRPPSPLGVSRWSGIERKLAAKAASFGVYVHRAVDALDPSILVGFLSDLTKTFNQFYEAKLVISNFTRSSSSGSGRSSKCSCSGNKNSRGATGSAFDSQQQQQQHGESHEGVCCGLPDGLEHSGVYVHPERLLLCRVVYGVLSKGLALLGVEGLKSL